MGIIKVCLQVAKTKSITTGSVINFLLNIPVSAGFALTKERYVLCNQ